MLLCLFAIPLRQKNVSAFFRNPEMHNKINKTIVIKKKINVSLSYKNICDKYEAFFSKFSERVSSSSHSSNPHLCLTISRIFIKHTIVFSLKENLKFLEHVI